MSLPAIRFRDGAGQTFADWKETTLGEVTELFSRRNKNLIDAEVYSVTNSNGFVLQIEYFEDRVIAGSDLSNYKIIYRDEFAYNPARINVGSIALFSEKVGVISSLYVCFKCKDSLDNKFLLNFLALDSTKQNINSFGEGGVRIYLWYPLFSKIPIRLPSIREQKKIASFFTIVDAKITHLTKKYELLNKYKKGVMQKIFNYEIRFKNQEGQFFPLWEKKILKEITNVMVGGTPSTNNKKFWDNGTVPWISSAEINNGNVSSSRTYITEEGLNNSSAKLMPEGTVLLAMTGANLGRIGYLTFSTSGNQSVAGIMPNGKICSKFLYYQFFMNINQVFSKAGGAAQKGINKANIESLEFLIPTIEEQTKISQFLSIIDEKITTIQSQLELVKQYKQGLLQQMLI